MGESMVQRLEEQSENPGSGFCLPQTLYMNKENRISTHRVAFFCPRAWYFQSMRAHTEGRWEMNLSMPEHRHPIHVLLCQC